MTDVPRAIEIAAQLLKADHPDSDGYGTVEIGTHTFSDHTYWTLRLGASSYMIEDGDAQKGDTAIDLIGYVGTTGITLVRVIGGDYDEALQTQDGARHNRNLGPRIERKLADELAAAEARELDADARVFAALENAATPETTSLGLGYAAGLNSPGPMGGTGRWDAMCAARRLERDGLVVCREERGNYVWRLADAELAEVSR